jgi:hypothetical protein
VAGLRTHIRKIEGQLATARQEGAEAERRSIYSKLSMLGFTGVVKIIDGTEGGAS